MIGRQELQQQLFSTVQIESFIPQNHLLRKIDKILDFSFVREMTEHLYCVDNGRPSVDPVLFFRIYLIIFLYNIESDRQACDEINYNLAYRWFCRLSLEDSVPDHSSLTKIRDRLGEETFKKIFEKIINICIEKNLVKGTKIMMDGSFVKADAALSSMVPKDHEGDLKDQKTSSYTTGKKYSNKTHVSKTDPDCSLSGKKTEVKLLRYKVHESIDRDSSIIMDAHVTTGSEVDGKQMMGRIDHIEKTFDVKIEEFTGDRGYGYGENLEELQKRNIKSYVPNFHKDVGDNYDPEYFNYDKENDKFICKMGFELLPQDYPANLAQNQRTYRLLGGHCNKCPLREKCFTELPKDPRGRRIHVSIFNEIQMETKAREKTDDFREVRTERQWKMEGIFANAKNNHGLERARYRGRSKMQIQAYMIANAQNIKRLISLSPWLKSLLEKLIESFVKYFFGQNFTGYLSART